MKSLEVLGIISIVAIISIVGIVAIICKCKFSCHLNKDEFHMDVMEDSSEGSASIDTSDGLQPPDEREQRIRELGHY